ncbi:regulatory protein, luxR family [Dyadobacter sp. SG02]|uniref:response regulator transcription factor n=1 Tax=Dyadobacter sp. SG02 TaxID=1855291 RepID=UPI0008C637AE|nr:helix-turn-helix transcriptional regulator [Dyadobacter sp. SG02]SEJ79407.1 regulatory protein, luxR family [Dyadobacter sp. SG02]
MNKKLILTYRDHLDLLRKESEMDSWDYGSYYKQCQPLLSFSEVSSTAIFLLDYTSKKYPILGNGIEQVMGHKKEAFEEGGLDFMLQQYRDFEILNHEIFPDQVKAMNQHAPDELANLRFSRSYRFKRHDGKINTVLQRHTIISSEQSKVPVAIFGFAWDISNHTENGKVIHQIEKYDHTKKIWIPLLFKEYYPDIDQRSLLSRREIEILKWSVEGMSSKQIAEKLHIAFHTVNTHRRNMLRRTNCGNSMELLRYAIENKLL